MKASLELFSQSDWQTWEIEIFPLEGLSEEAFLWPIIYLCPHCQTIWARICFPQWRRTHIYDMPCESCPPGPWKHGELRRHSVPGSLLHNNGMLEWEPNLDLTVLRALPAELLRRELELHIAAWEKDPDERTAEFVHQSDLYLNGAAADTRTQLTARG